FSDVVEDASHSVEESFNLKVQPGQSSRSNALRIASDLRRVSSDLEKVQGIDERSNEIRTRLIELITLRATAFEKAENDTALATAAAANRAAFEAAFRDFSEWEEKTAQEMQSVFGK